MSNTTKNNQILIYFKNEIHFVNDLKINVFIEINMVNFEKIKLNFKNNTLIISICKNFQTLIQIKRRNKMINRVVQIIVKTIIFFDINMSISIKMKNKNAYLKIKIIIFIL